MDSLLTMIIPHPDPLPLSAPPALIWFLLVLTFFLHLLPMNFILGGSIISALLGRKKDPPREELRSFLAKAMPPMVAAAVSLGVAPLLMTQVLFGRLFFSSSVLMAWYWISVIPILILAYYGTYLAAFKGNRLGRARPWVTGIIALLFLAIAFIYTNNMSLLISPERFAEMHAASAAGDRLNLADPTLIPRWLHMVLGAVAVAGLVIAVYGAKRLDTNPESGRFAPGNHAPLHGRQPGGQRRAWPGDHHRDRGTGAGGGDAQRQGADETASRREQPSGPDPGADDPGSGPDPPGSTGRSRLRDPGVGRTPLGPINGFLPDAGGSGGDHLLDGEGAGSGKDQRVALAIASSQGTSTWGR